LALIDRKIKTVANMWYKKLPVQWLLNGFRPQQAYCILIENRSANGNFSYHHRWQQAKKTSIL
jgi:hypothetical protein